VKNGEREQRMGEINRDGGWRMEDGGWSKKLPSHCTISGGRGGGGRTQYYWAEVLIFFILKNKNLYLRILKNINLYLRILIL
jgi:hypothetical protein